MTTSAKSICIFAAAAVLSLLAFVGSIGAGLFGLALMAMGGNGGLLLALGVIGLGFAFVFTGRVVLPLGQIVVGKTSRR